MNLTARFIRAQFIFACISLAPIFASSARGIFFSGNTKIAEVENYSIEDQRDIFKTFNEEDKNQKGIPLDPFDLMHRLRQVGAMDNATTPSDALDEALNAFDESGY